MSHYNRNTKFESFVISKIKEAIENDCGTITELTVEFDRYKYNDNLYFTCKFTRQSLEFFGHGRISDNGHVYVATDYLD